MIPVAILIHVDNVDSALSWYQRAIPEVVLKHHEPNIIAILNVNGFLVEIVKSDCKVQAGPSGGVLYWQIPDLEVALNRLLEIGATLYRGPMQIEEGLAMCQVMDPYGNLIGLRGAGNTIDNNSDRH